LIPLTLGTIDVGQFINASQAVTNAAREGCRAVVKNPDGNVRTAVLDYLAGCYPRVPRETISSGLTVPNPTLSGEEVTVTVELNFSAVRWVNLPLVPWSEGVEVLRSRTTMRKEIY
jgi:hypothetical protein